METALNVVPEKTTRLEEIDKKIFMLLGGNEKAWDASKANQSRGDSSLIQKNNIAQYEYASSVRDRNFQEIQNLVIEKLKLCYPSIQVEKLEKPVLEPDQEFRTGNKVSYEVDDYLKITLIFEFFYFSDGDQGRRYRMGLEYFEGAEVYNLNDLFDKDENRRGRSPEFIEGTKFGKILDEQYSISCAMQKDIKHVIYPAHCFPLNQLDKAFDAFENVINLVC